MIRTVLIWKEFLADAGAVPLNASDDVEGSRDSYVSSNERTGGIVLTFWH